MSKKKSTFAPESEIGIYNESKQDFISGPATYGKHGGKSATSLCTAQDIGRKGDQYSKA